MNGFYLKLTIEQATSIMEDGIPALFDEVEAGRPQERFNEYFHKHGEQVPGVRYYTYYIEDSVTGDKYFKINNVQFKGIPYDVISFIDTAYPTITKYDHEYVKQFLPEEGI